MLKMANVGSLDRIIRIVIGALLIAAPYLFSLQFLASPLGRWGTLAVGVVLILTALVRFCPLYRLIGASTCKVN